MPPKPPAAPPASLKPSPMAVTDLVVTQAVTSDWAGDIVQFLPRTVRAKQFLQQASLCILESEDLRECMTTQQGRLSLLRALQRGAASGLSLNPQEGKAALVAFGGKVTWMPMKNGLIDILMDTGSCEAADAFIVMTNDHFVLKKTAHGDEFDFSPNLDDRGTVRGYCAFALTTAGKSFVKYMSKKDVEEWRDSKVPQATLYYQYSDTKNNPPKFKKGDPKPKSFWWANPDGAGLKTVAKRLCLELHIPAIDKAVEADGFDDFPEEGGPNDRPPRGTGGADLAATMAARQTEPEAEPIDRTHSADEDPGDFGGQASAAPTEDEQPGLGLEGEAKPTASAPVAPSKGPGAPPARGQAAATASAAPSRPTAPKVAPTSAPKPATAAPAVNPAIPADLRGDVVCSNDACQAKFRKGECDESHLISGQCPKCGGKLIDDSIF